MDEGKRPTNIALVQKVLQAARGNPVAPLLPGSQQHSVPPLPPPQPKPYVSTSYASAGTLLFRYAARPRGIETVRWSPDGTRIVISNGKTLQVLSLTSNKQPSFIDENLPKSILSMTWSPDGNIAAVAADGTMHIWNAEDSGLPLIFQEKLPNSLIAWSPDLTRIAFPGKDETVQVVSLLNRQTVMYECRSRGLFGSEKRENAYLHQICWSPDGTHLAALSQERSVFVWSTNGGGQHFSPEPRYKSRDKGALSFAWSADGTSLAAVSQERSIFVWSTNGSRQRFSPKPRDRYKYHRDFSLSPDGTSIALFSYGSIELWNFCQNNYFAITYKYIHEHKGHPKRGYSGEYYQNLHPIRTMSWSPDGSRIAFAFLDGTIRVWNTDGSGPPLIYNHSDVFEKAFLAWSPDGKYLAFTSRSYLDTDSEVRIWYLGDDDALIYRGHLDSIKALAWAPDSKRITSASCDSLQVWNVSDAFIDEPDFSIVWSFEQLPDGTPIASASDGRKIHFFDAAGQKQPFIDDNIADSFVAKSPNGKYIARVFNKTTIQVANADRSGRSFSYTNHSRAVLVIAWSPDSTRIASASEDGTIHVWYVNGNGQPVIYQAHSGMIQSLAWSPDSTCIVSASKASEDAIHVWNAHDGRQLFIYRGHNYRAFGIFVSSVAWSPDGKRIASSTSGAPDAPNSIGKIVHVWNADGSGPPFIYKGHDSGVSLVKWSPDGTKIVSVSEDGVVLVWSAG
ncbi:MAG TPA: WD40 repeat domain-containing protein [Ktedonobacteraceae bacterium]|nr:WD40 repeat domain-containing protein [Ktedonobacteraceae bacterium]